MDTCPLCHSPEAQVILRKEKTYLKCQTCLLLFLHRDQRLSPGDELERYNEHNNDLADPRYLHYLKKLWDRFPGPTKGRALDYGCGPSKGLAELLKTSNTDLAVDSYDPFYFPRGIEHKAYDYIYCSEAAEHFWDPQKEFLQLHALLKPQGHLVLRTELWHEDLDFQTWYYADDPTHVCFFHKHSFNWLARTGGWSVQVEGPQFVRMIKTQSVF